MSKIWRLTLFFIIINYTQTLLADTRVGTLQRLKNRFNTLIGYGPVTDASYVKNGFVRFKGNAISMEGNSIRVIKGNGESMEIEKPFAGVNKSTHSNDLNFKESYYPEWNNQFGYKLGKENTWNSANFMWEPKNGELTLAKFNKSSNTIRGDANGQKYSEYSLFKDSDEGTFHFTASEKFINAANKSDVDFNQIETSFKLPKNEVLRTIKSVRVNYSGGGELEIVVHNTQDNSDTVKKILIRSKSNEVSDIPNDAANIVVSSKEGVN